jgi:hypothetical protein
VYIKISVVVDHKRKVTKVTVLKPESSDTKDEDAYMASQLNGLNIFISILESTLGALKKEVTNMDSHLTQKCHHYHLLQ